MTVPQLVSYYSVSRCIAYFMPWVSMPVAIALVWKWIYDPQLGVLDNLLAGLNLPQPGWLNDPLWAMPSLIIMAVWKSLGYNMIIFLAGLQGIPQDLYEAASIDGAGAIARFWRITVPLISPATFSPDATGTVHHQLALPDGRRGDRQPAHARALHRAAEAVRAGHRHDRAQRLDLIPAAHSACFQLAVQGSGATAWARRPAWP
jgi:Binding-protein-dependent transport system inner membrane component